MGKKIKRGTKRDRRIKRSLPDAEEELDVAKLDHLLLSRRIDRFAQTSSLTLFPALASILVFLASFAPEAPLYMLLPWGFCAAAIVLTRIVVARRLDPECEDIENLRRQWRIVNATLVAGSVAWAISFPYAAYFGGSVQHAILGLVGAAILNAVLLAHRYAPKAALFHILVVGAGFASAVWIIGGMGGLVVIALILVYSLTLSAMVRMQEAAFVRACTTELLRRESENTVRVLLKEYETQAQDFLWAVDAGGILCNVSPRLAEVAGISAEDLSGKRLIDLLEPGPERDGLALLLAEKKPFRDANVVFAQGKRKQWWSLSARPRSDGRMSGVGRDVTATLEVERRVQHMAHYDQLTGLANRYLFDKKLRETLRSADDTSKVALFYLDLDDFKIINDTQGHGLGDRLLSEMGRRLAQQVRGSDLVARLGGDEFAVLMKTEAGDSMLLERAHRFLAAAREPFDIDGQEFRVSTSIGIARCEAGANDDEGCEANELMRRADLALYAAKASGRDEFAIFDETIDQAAKERRRLETELRDAISKDELRLHYQPIIELDGGSVSGYEVLVRWQHPRRGLLVPDQFLAIAEDTGLILRLGEWVIHRALAEMSEWEGDSRIAINLSPTQMRSAQLVPTMAEALAVSGMDPRRLELEVTENVLIRDGEASLGTMRRLIELGAKVALDDFGTGYSSLSYLRSYPFDRIKIDRNFVEDVTTSEEARAIVSAITNLAKALGMRTTAEGVEREGQLEILRELGCNEAQGYFIHRPVPGELVEEVPGDGMALPQHSAGVLDYRRARNAATRRKGKRIA